MIMSVSGTVFHLILYFPADLSSDPVLSHETGFGGGGGGGEKVSLHPGEIFYKKIK